MIACVDNYSVIHLLTTKYILSSATNKNYFYRERAIKTKALCEIK